MQRYISKELTHFVGRNESKDKRYQLFCDILKTGRLGDFSDKNSLELSYDTKNNLSSNEVYTSNIVCFCDIPLSDLNNHMEHYSQFGVAFDKKYLTNKGATPVFYVSRDSIVHDLRLKSFKSNEKIFDSHYKTFSKILDTKNIDSSIHNDKIKDELHYLSLFLHMHVFSFMKFYDESKKENDPENYYMEREWRIFGGLDFKLKDVSRVFLPKKYSEQFRRDLPSYYGQTNYS